MEAVPRLPMLSFDLKVSPDRPPADFGKLKQYIRDFYNEDPETYSTEIRNLESLRAQAVHPVKDVTGCSVLKRYYCQLHFLQSRFPMGKDGAAAVTFTWKDTYASMVCSLADIRFEIVAILYNIGALHSQLGAADDRTTPEGLKLACSHFQCAAWAFQHLKDSFPQPSGMDLSPDLMQFLYHLCLAQAQECILEKSMTDNRKATINAKVATQIVDYYHLALNALLPSPSDEGSIIDTISTKLFKTWKKYTRFKATYYSCVSLLYLGMQSEEQQKMGERVGFYQAALDRLNEAIKVSKGVDPAEAVAETLTFTRDVVEGKRKAAKNENEFIYHEEVPDFDTLPTVKGASLVKGIPFNINDPDISGPDIFARLVPMKAHEASSLYSEEKAKLLRRISGMIDSKDEEVVGFMSCLQLENIKAHLDPSLLPQEIIDRCAAMSAKPDAIPNLISAMDKLNDAYHDVDAMLKEIMQLIKTEEVAEKEYQEIMGSRPPSIIATDLTREANKYMEAHKKAAESNDTLHRAMSQHIENLRVLQQPLQDLQSQLPTLTSLNLGEDQSLKDVCMLVGKVEEMRRQRAMLASQLRESICSDDITAQLVTRSNDNMETIFQQEMQKHNRYVSLIEQNLLAQDNILPALTDAYAKYAPTRKATAEIIRQRDMMLSALISSYDAYEDLIAKSAKGLEFYRKLETNLTKLLQRVKGTCKVQQEERDTILARNGRKPLQQELDYNAPLPTSSGPKLKDYLQSKKAAQGMSQGGSYYSQNSGYPGPGEAQWMPGVRPAPVGSEGTASDCSGAIKQADYTPQTSHTYSVPSTSYSTYMPHIPSSPYPQTYAYNLKAYQAPSSLQNYYTANNSSLQNLQYPTLSDHSSLPAQSGQTVTPSFTQPDTPQHTADPSASNQYQYQTVPQSTTYSPQHYSQYIPTSNLASQQYTMPTQSQYSEVMASVARRNVYDQTAVGAYTPQQYLPVAGATTSIYSYRNPQVSQKPQVETASGQTEDPSQTYPTPATAAYSGYASGYQTAYNSYRPTQVVPENQAATSMYTQDERSPNYPVNSTQDTSKVVSTEANTQNYYTQYAQNFNASVQGQYQYTPGTETYYNQCTSEEQAAQPALQGHAYMGSTPAVTYNSYYSHPYAGYSTMSSASQAPLNSPQQAPVGNALPGYAAVPQSQASATNYVPQAQSATPSKPADPVASSNVDLLAGLDFTVNETPLQPKQQVDSRITETQEALSSLSLSSQNSTTPQPPVVNQPSGPESQPQPQVVITKAGVSPKMENQSPSKLPVKDPFWDPEVLSQFVQEVEKFEKFVDGLSTKTLNGPTPLDLKWNELQDLQDKDAHKQIISVARCYPMKNRFPDILPFDSTRVELPSTKDDYINASIVKNLGQYCPNFIMTQAPLPSTYADFWVMVLEQQVELVVCLLADSQLNGEIYWAVSKTEDLVMGKVKVSLQSCNVRGHWVERIMSVTNGKTSRVVVHLQFTAWPQRWFPESPGPLLCLVSETLSVWGQQRGRGGVVVHCDSGVGRSGCFVVVCAAVADLHVNPHLPDLVPKTAEVARYRKNPLRDRDHLKFAYQCLLYYAQDLLMKRGILASKSSFEEKRTKPKSHTRHPSEDFLLNSLRDVNSEERRASDASSTGSIKPSETDPLSQIDPLWPIKRYKNETF